MSVQISEIRPRADLAQVAAGPILALAYNSIAKTVRFDPGWVGATGYLDYAVRGPAGARVAAGELARSLWPGENRRVVLVGTAVGTVALFERFNNGQGGIVVFSAPSNFARLDLPRLRSGAVTAQDLEWALDTRGGMARHIERLRQVFAGELGDWAGRGA